MHFHKYYEREIIMLEQKNSKKQGDVGLGIAIGWCTAKGYCVSIPLSDSQEYDLVVDIGGKLNKVQIKTTNAKSKYNIYAVGLRTGGGNQSFITSKLFDPKAVDYLFILTGEGTKYFIPCTEMDNVNSISLGKLVERYKVDY